MCIDHIEYQHYSSIDVVNDDNLSRSPSLLSPSSSSQLHTHGHDGHSLSSRLVVIPVINEGLNNQIIHLEKLVEWARREDATLCWPRVTLRASIADALLLERPFGALFDRAQFQSCVAQHYNVTMALSTADHQLCYWLTDTLLRSIIRSNDMDIAYNWQHKLPWPMIMDVLGHNHSLINQYGGYDALITNNRSYHSLQPSFITALQTTFRQYIRHYPTLRRNDDLIKYSEAWEEGIRVFTTKSAFPLWDIQWNGYGTSPLLQHGCIRGPPSIMHLQQRVRHGITALRDTYLEKRRHDRSIIPVIGLHLRAEKGLPCAPDAQYIVTHFCQRFRVPCASAIVMVATGLPDEEFIPVLKKSFLGTLSTRTHTRMTFIVTQSYHLI
jgi:hypothetical protein